MVDWYLIVLQRVFKEAATQYLDKTKEFIDQRDASVDFYILEVGDRGFECFIFVLIRIGKERVRRNLPVPKQLACNLFCGDLVQRAGDACVISRAQGLGYQGVSRLTTQSMFVVSKDAQSCTKYQLVVNIVVDYEVHI